MAEGLTTLTGRPDQRAGDRVRGTGAWDLRATVHTHSARIYPLDAFIVSGSVSKTLSAPAGSFSVVVKERVLSRGTDDRHAWDEIVAPGDWIEIDAVNGKHQRPLMFGRIDSINRNRAAGPNGAQVVTHSIAGGDAGRMIAATSITDMRAINLSRIAAQVDALKAVNELARVSKLTPDTIVKFLVDYTLAGGAYRHPTARCWSLPPTLALRARAPGRQLHDLISFDYVDEVEGRLAASVAFASSLPGAGRAWDTMAQYANTALNELFIDLRPPVHRQHTNGELRLSLVLREKPFPYLPESAPWRAATFGAAWDALPATEIHAFDLESEQLACSDAERTNYWSFVSGGVDAPYRDVVAEAAFRSRAGGSGDALSSGAPRIHASSVERHQLRRMEQQSLYVDPAAIAGLTSGAEPTGWMLYTGWTGLIRDWYAINHRLLSGTLPVGFALPGIRVGERVRIRSQDGAATELYVEGVDHSFRRGANGAPASRTRLTVTRGLRIGNGGYTKAYRDALTLELAS